MLYNGSFEVVFLNVMQDMLKYNWCFEVVFLNITQDMLQYNWCFMSAGVPQAYRFHTFKQYWQNIKLAALGHKTWQFNNCFLQSYMLFIFLFT